MTSAARRHRPDSASARPRVPQQPDAVSRVARARRRGAARQARSDRLARSGRRAGDLGQVRLGNDPQPGVAGCGASVRPEPPAGRRPDHRRGMSCQARLFWAETAISRSGRCAAARPEARPAPCRRGSSATAERLPDPLSTSRAASSPATSCGLLEASRARPRRGQLGRRPTPCARASCPAPTWAQARRIAGRGRPYADRRAAGGAAASAHVPPAEPAPARDGSRRGAAPYADRRWTA